MTSTSITETSNTEHRPLRPFEAFAISLAFWATLLCASAMYAVLSLAPGLVEQTNLNRQYEQIVNLASNRTQEVHHLERVTVAMERDPEFVARLARNELSLVPAGSTQFRVANSLGYDARVPVDAQPLREVDEAWYGGLLVQLSEPTGFRQNWIATTLSLFMVAFLCLNESFFSGRLGRGVLSLLTNFCRRYRVSSPKLD